MLEQKEWMVWIFKPPGVSIARAKSRRAVGRLTCPVRSSTPNSSRSLRSSASDNIDHLPNRRNKRFCISEAAAFVYVRQRMFCGSTPSNNNRATRSVRTRVLPDPAFAVSHVFNCGSAASTWVCVASFRIMRRPQAWHHHSGPIRQSGTDDRRR